MGKADELLRAAGGNIAESTARREASVLGVMNGPSLSPARMDGVARSKATLEIPIERIERDPDQPREEFDPEALSRLAESIRARGLLQPVRVRWSEERGRYVLIAGERRWRAAGMAGLPTITCVVDPKDLTPAELLADQVTENLLREDLAPLERARAFRTLMDLNGWSGNQLSKELGISQTAVVHALALLDLPGPVQARVDRGELAPSVAYQVGKLDDPAAQEAVAERIVAEDLSRAEAIQAVREASDRSARLSGGKGRGAKAKAPKPRTFARLHAGRVVVEPRAAGPEGILAALREAVAVVEAEVKAKGRGEAAA